MPEHRKVLIIGGGGGGGSGTVTEVTSANANIAVAFGTTTPELTLNSTLSGINSVTSATGQTLTLATLDSNANVVLAPHGTGSVTTTKTVLIGSTADSTVDFNLSRNITGGVIRAGFATEGVIQSDVTTRAVGYYGGIGTAAASFTLSELRQFGAYFIAKGAGSTVTKAVGYWAANGDSGAASTRYGFEGTMVADGANAYNLYMSGSAPNYMAGALSVGGAVTLGALTSNGLVTTSGGTGATSVTVPGTGVLTALAVNVGTDGAFVIKGGALGTPSSGNLGSCTFPTLNQNTTGSAASLSISGQTGLLTVTGLASTNRVKTVRDAADTILELGGSYTPTGTWTSLTMVTPVLGTPTSGTLTNCTIPASGITAGTLGANITFGENTELILDAALSADGKYCGITESVTAGETVAFGEIVYLKAADSRYWLADADADATAGAVKVAIAVTSGTAGNAMTVLHYGKIRADAKFPTLTIGAPAYISTTAGAIQVAQPSGTDDVIRIVGHALTADELFFSPSTEYMTHT